LRELTRTRLVLVAQRTRLKNRIGSTLEKYGMTSTASDPYGKGGRAEPAAQLEHLPPHARWVYELLLAQLDFLIQQIRPLEVTRNDPNKTDPQH
jgi:transposase